MAYNKIEANGETLIDLTSDTVTADTLVSGRTAHLASGERVTGTFEPVTGVKGNAESTYRKGNVNLTPANIGAATSAQGTKADSAVQTIKMNGNAVTKTSGVVDLGTVITAHQDISGKADKSATVSNVTYDTTNKKLTKTINGTTSDVVTAAQLKTDMALSKSDVGLGNVGNFKAVSTVASQGLTDTEKANARTNIGAGTSSFSGSYNDLTNKPAIPPSEISETSDTTPYLYKASEHDALYDELVGGSVAWNQLVANSGSSLSVTITSGHKYAMKKSGILSVGASSGSAITGFTGGTDWITDLTLMFGTTIADYVYSLEQSTAGSGIVWLKSYGFFTKDYYAYNAGGLVSANVSGKKVVGKNLLEITTESTTINGVTFTVDKAAGTVTANGTASSTIWSFILIQNKIYPYDVIISGCPQGGNWTDTYSIQTDSVDGITYYDLGDGVTFPKGKSLLLRIVICSGYAANNLVFKPMIRRADTGSTFEPYTSLTYPIQSTDLRGLYKLNGNKLYTDGDIYSADGQITRKYGIVDLGTLEWVYDASHNRIYATNALIKRNNDSTIANAVCNKYTICTRDDLFTTDKAVSINYSGGTSWINVRDTAYITKEAFKTAMSGVYLIYELATPTTETAQPFASPHMVYRNGTEEYLDTRDVPIPVGGNRKYVDIPDWMVNEYFDDLRNSAYELTQDLDDISGELDCLTIRAALVNNEVIIQNTSDFTSKLYSKYFSYTKPKFAILKLQITSNTYYYKALINSSSVSHGNLMEASFITVNGGYMGIYNFRWNFSSTVGTPTVSYTSLNLGS